MSPHAKLSVKERWEFFLDHQDKELHWFQSKFKIGKRTLQRYRSRAKKEKLDIQNVADPEDEVIISSETISEINTGNLEKEMLRLYNLSPDEERKKQMKTLLEIWKFKHRVPITASRSEIEPLGNFLHVNRRRSH